MDSSSQAPHPSQAAPANSSSPAATAPAPTRLATPASTSDSVLAVGAHIAGLEGACAYWLEPDLFAWPATFFPAGYDSSGQAFIADGDTSQILPLRFSLLASRTGGIALEYAAVQLPESGLEYPLKLLGKLAELRPDLLASYPQLHDYVALAPQDHNGLATFTLPELQQLVSGQLAVVQQTDSEPGWVTALTQVQIWPLLDHLWGRAAATRDGSVPLGVSFQPLSFALWAPTAQAVHLLTWNTGDPLGSVPLMPGSPIRTTATYQSDGHWEVDGQTVTSQGINEGCQYLWEVSVYVPSTGHVECNVVTDPYSRALTLDSTRSVAVNLDRPELMPDIWHDTPAPLVSSDTARAIYEIHLRDFSATDLTVPDHLRGKYGAFGINSEGTRHLRDLAHAGIDTVHLLPIFDFATVPEAEQLRREPVIPDVSADDSPAQQAAIGQCADTDSYNWGYDPWHWMAPEGSYALSEAGHGGARVVQVRQMVGHLHALGLQVVLDQVFNHTAAAGQAEHSVLDRIVPGYYHRLDTAGRIETSACGTNVATERAMAERLMIDTCATWVRDYRVDGFRFDLMGYHSVQTMCRLRQAVNDAAFTPGPGGAVGHQIFLYGEGWNMGEVADNRLFHQAIQGQTGNGLHIATFNDRVRDAVVGPQFVADPRAGQGWGSGAAGDPNHLDVPADTQGAGGLTWQADLIRLSLTGNLRDWPLREATGSMHESASIRYAGQRADYADEPIDALAYVSSHDDETLFDRLAYKLPVGLPMRERVRMNTLCLAVVTLSQSPVFWAAGVELLRSKSLDRDSYNSGDWFNAIDWSGCDNGWGRGLPPAWRNFDRWLIQAPLLALRELRPSPADIAFAREQALTLLQLRRSTPLFSLGSADLIRKYLSFPLFEPKTVSAGDVDGLILMLINDGSGTADIDPEVAGVLVAFNPYPYTVSVHSHDLCGRDFRLSPLQAGGTDPLVKETNFDSLTGTLTVPRRTAAVLLES